MFESRTSNHREIRWEKKTMKRLFAIFTLTLVVVFSEQHSGCAAPNSPPAENGVIAVPEGGPDVLVPFIQNLLKQRPRTPEELARMREAVLKAAEKILASQPNPSQLLFAVQAKAAMLNNLQELAEFEDAVRKLGNEAAVRVVQARILFVKLEQARSNLTAFRKLLDEAEKFLREGKLQPAEVELALHIGELAEQTGDTQLAGEAYEKMAELLKARPELAPAVRQLAGRARRCKLPGNPMHLEGKTLDGQDLDWGKYRGKVVLVDFWATWCGPCHMLKPVFRSVAAEYQGRAKFGSLDVDRSPVTAGKYNIRSLPTLILFKNGRQVAKRVGYCDADTIKAMIDPHLG